MKKEMYVIFYKGTNKIHSYTMSKELMSYIDAEYLEYIKITDMTEISKIQMMLDNVSDDSCDIYDDPGLLYTLIEKDDNIISGYENAKFEEFIGNLSYGIQDLMESTSRLMECCVFKDISNLFKHTYSEVEMQVYNFDSWGTCYMYPNLQTILSNYVADMREKTISERCKKCI